MVYIFLADGFEEIEALATVDILRRGCVDVLTASITYEREVKGAHGIEVVADKALDEIRIYELEAVILPGGMPGTINLENSVKVEEILNFAFKKDLLICAICAAPSVLGKYGMLTGKKAVCYPGFEEELIGAEVLNEPVVRDGNIITSRGAGTAHLFAKEILTALRGSDEAEFVLGSMMYE